MKNLHFVVTVSLVSLATASANAQQPPPRGAGQPAANQPDGAQPEPFRPGQNPDADATAKQPGDDRLQPLRPVPPDGRNDGRGPAYDDSRPPANEDRPPRPRRAAAVSFAYSKASDALGRSDGYALVLHATEVIDVGTEYEVRPDLVAEALYLRAAGYLLLGDVKRARQDVDDVLGYDNDPTRSIRGEVLSRFQGSRRMLLEQLVHNPKNVKGDYVAPARPAVVVGPPPFAPPAVYYPAPIPLYAPVYAGPVYAAPVPYGYPAWPGYGDYGYAPRVW